MEIINVKGNTYCINTVLTNLPFYKINEEEIVLLDSGWAEERDEIVKILEEYHLKVRGILNTHAHVDHIGNNAYFKDKENCLIAMPALEANICASSVNLKVYYSTLSLSNIEKHFGHMVNKTDILITDDEDKVSLCGVDFKIMHTPGHSPSHICIVTPDQVAYIGDTLISYDVMESAKMPYAFILSQDLKSKAKLSHLNCSYYILAHKAIYEDITSLITDNINFYKSRAFRIHQIIENNMNFEEILKAVLKEFNIKIKTINKYVVIERMLRSYIEYLTETNMLEIQMNDGTVEYKKNDEKREDL
ncbi:MAG: hydrolase [Haloplasmataceae bacterium]|jgi:glyoxylase-like metal-dependent hydrolase (beta-lactamase superfamily II)|nr:hydrolase [Haloplasmataceae bacterium]